jgi:hypothetical protein
MAVIPKSGAVSLASPLPDSQHQTPELKAGEALTAGDPCYIQANGRVYRSLGAAANAAAKVRGFAAKDTAIGEAVTLYHGVRLGWNNAGALTPGANVYLGAAAGTLDDAATTGGTAPLGFVVDPYRVYVDASRY